MGAGDPKMLVDDEVWDELKRLAARRRRSSAVVVVPYVTKALLDLRAGDTLGVDLSEATLSTGQTNPRVLKQYFKAGVHLFSSPGLHAKIFVLGDTAVVGSANMSEHSERHLREAVVVLKDREAVNAARAAAMRLLGPELTKADLDAAQALYKPAKRGSRAPQRPSSKHPAGPPPAATDRLWVIGSYQAEWPVTATKYADAAKRRIRSQAGAASEVEIGSVLWDLDDAPKLRVDDLVIEAWAPAASEPFHEVLYPARVIDQLVLPGRGRSPGWVITYWRRPKVTTPRPWDDLRTAALGAGTRFGSVVPLRRRITDPRLHAALRQLWLSPARS